MCRRHTVDASFVACGLDDGKDSRNQRKENNAVGGWRCNYNLSARRQVATPGREKVCLQTLLGTSLSFHARLVTSGIARSLQGTPSFFTINIHPEICEGSGNGTVI